MTPPTSVLLAMALALLLGALQSDAAHCDADYSADESLNSGAYPTQGAASLAFSNGRGTAADGGLPRLPQRDDYFYALTVVCSGDGNISASIVDEDDCTCASVGIWDVTSGTPVKMDCEQGNGGATRNGVPVPPDWITVQSTGGPRTYDIVFLFETGGNDGVDDDYLVSSTFALTGTCVVSACADVPLCPPPVVPVVPVRHVQLYVINGSPNGSLAV
jgi:hypothetical protein